jgi:ribosomal protein S18 acetylase RimI-like enzyme
VTNFRWLAEKPARWDESKQRIIGDAPVGIFDRRYGESGIGELLPGEWWRVEEGGAVVGYGWLDVVWGDAEILLAVLPEAQDRGVGGFILEELEREAAARGLNYLYNVVRPTHPDASRVSAWLERRGFRASEDGSLLRVVAHRKKD